MPKKENTVAFIKNMLTMQCAFGIIIKLTFGTVLWPVGQAAKTPASHAGNAGSIPARVTIVGVDCDEVPPVPIPNTEVKLIGAENTWLEAAREDRSTPTLFLIALIAQSVEHAAVNRGVTGSSPVWGANNKTPSKRMVFCCF